MPLWCCNEGRKSYWTSHLIQQGQLPAKVITCNCSSLRSLLSLYNRKQQNNQRAKMQLEAADEKILTKYCDPSQYLHTYDIWHPLRSNMQQLWKAPAFTNWPDDLSCSTKNPQQSRKNYWNAITLVLKKKKVTMQLKKISIDFTVAQNIWILLVLNFTTKLYYYYHHHQHQQGRKAYQEKYS